MDRSAAAATEKCGFRPKSIAALQRATRRAHSLSWAACKVSRCQDVCVRPFVVPHSKSRQRQRVQSSRIIKMYVYAASCRRRHVRLLCYSPESAALIPRYYSHWKSRAANIWLGNLHLIKSQYEPSECCLIIYTCVSVTGIDVKSCWYSWRGIDPPPQSKRQRSRWRDMVPATGGRSDTAAGLLRHHKAPRPLSHTLSTRGRGGGIWCQQQAADQQQHRAWCASTKHHAPFPLLSAHDQQQHRAWCASTKHHAPFPPLSAHVEGWGDMVPATGGRSATAADLVRHHKAPRPLSPTLSTRGG